LLYAAPVVTLFFNETNETFIWDVEIVEQERPTAVKAMAVVVPTVATG
jgi:hypothetical protein